MLSPTTLRLLDANLNRAREALRVMEDVARFVLNDARLAGDVKNARHDLRTAAEGLGLSALALAASRDTPGDVGTTLHTPSERARASVRDVATAAGKRAGEALRVLEETGKLCRPSGTGVPPVSQTNEAHHRRDACATDTDFKALRYRVYDLEARLTLALGGGRARQWRLCVLITDALCLHHAWEKVAEVVLHAGADCLQLREKTMDAGDLLRRARRLVELARRISPTAAVIVNDRPDIALLAGADGVHLGQTDLSVADVRALASDRSAFLVGVSTCDLAQAHQAAAAGADYCGVGPMFPTTTKHKPTLAGAAYLKAYLADPQAGPIPHLAIGGITPTNVRELAEVGCQGVAVSSAICGAVDPARACKAILDTLS